MDKPGDNIFSKLFKESINLHLCRTFHIRNPKIQEQNRSLPGLGNWSVSRETDVIKYRVWSING